MSETDSLCSSRLGIWSGLASEEPALPTPSEIGVLGLPFDGGVSFRGGAALGPSRLRELSKHLAPCSDEGRPLAVRVRDHGDVAPEKDRGAYFETIENRVGDILRHPLALFLGGDHSVTIPVLQGVGQAQDGPLGFVHFDAHPDLFDEYEGDPRSHACTARRALELKGLDERHLVFVGLRSIAQEEWAFLQSHSDIPYFTARQCWLRGVSAIAEEVVTRLQSVQAVYLTVDIDGLDPAYAPGTGYTEGGGPSTRELLELVRILCRELPVRAMDVVEVAPPLDQNDITSFAALKVIYEAWASTQERLTRGVDQ